MKYRAVVVMVNVSSHLLQSKFSQRAKPCDGCFYQRCITIIVILIQICTYAEHTLLVMSAFLPEIIEHCTTNSGAFHDTTLLNKH